MSADDHEWFFTDRYLAAIGNIPVAKNCIEYMYVYTYIDILGRNQINNSKLVSSELLERTRHRVRNHFIIYYFDFRNISGEK